MDPEQHDEWQRLQQHALDSIRNGSNCDRSKAQWLFQIVVMPAFKNTVSWEICKIRNEPDSYFAAKSTWLMRTDADKLATPVARLRCPRVLSPTMEVRRYGLTPRLVDTALASLTQMIIPAIAEDNGITLDGVSFELALGSRSARATNGWADSAPAGWEPLSEWMHQTLVSYQ